MSELSAALSSVAVPVFVPDRIIIVLAEDLSCSIQCPVS